MFGDARERAASLGVDTLRGVSRLRAVLPEVAHLVNVIALPLAPPILRLLMLSGIIFLSVTSKPLAAGHAG